MNPPLSKTLLALVPVCLLLAGSVLLFRRQRSAGPLLQLVGAACLTVVVLTHLAEALSLFPAMGWGRPHSLGHYLDLSSAALGVTLFPLGYVIGVLTRR